MKSSCAVLLTLLAGGNAFCPPTALMGVRTSSGSTQLQMKATAPESRRAMLNKVLTTSAGLAGVAAMPALAGADGARSKATIERARGIYGSRVEDLSAAVTKGDFAAIMGEKNAFTLFASGGFQKKTDTAKAKELAKAVVDAAAKGDASTMQSSYKDLIELAKLDTGFKAEGRDMEYSQGYSSDYDYKRGTKKGTIYVR